MDKKKEKIDFSIIIPNYNGEDLLKQNLPSIIASSKYKKNDIKEILVVDDYSTDNSVEFIKNEFPEVKLIKHRENRRFAAAVNTGARTASANFLVLLNSDVKTSKDFLVSVIDHFKNENVFAVSLHEKGYGPSKGDFQEGFLVHKAAKESKQPRISFWASGGSAVFRRSMWMKLKGMDEELYSPFYWEDVDISYRAQKRGWLIYWEPGAVVEHDHESTNIKIDARYRRRIQERNHLLFNWRNITSASMVRKHIRGLLKRIIRHPGYLRIVFMALSKLTFITEKRKIEKKESSVADEAVLGKF